MRRASSIARSGVGGAPGLHRAVGEEARPGRDAEPEQRLDQEADPDVAGEEEVVEQPGDAVHEHREPHEREDAGRDPDHRALDELGDLLADLGLGELDLLAEQDRDALGDVEDELADGPSL